MTDMPNGYKMTEVGVIPEDWEVKTLGEIGNVRMCKRILKHQTCEHGDVPFYKIGTFGGAADAFIPQSLYDDFRCRYPCPKKGDVLISAAGTIGRTVIYDGAPAYFQDSNIVWIENDESKATNEYLSHRYQVTKWSVSHGGTVARLYNDSLKNKIHIPLPPLSEQRAIAAALSDVDALLEGLDRLVAKKRDLKQAAMQQLLTGQTRLPGFHGEWETKRLGDIAEIRSGGTPSTTNSKFWDGGIPWCTPTDITALYGQKYLTETARTISTTGLRASSAEVIAANSIIMTSRATIGECAINTIPMTTNQGFKNLIPLVVDAEFLYYLMTTQKQRLLQLCGGSTFLEIGKKQLQQLELLIPVIISEQTAIASVLSDMDAEIDSLERRRAKTADMKQAMMQELLTGRIRLV